MRRAVAAADGGEMVEVDYDKNTVARTAVVASGRHWGTWQTWQEKWAYRLALPLLFEIRRGPGRGTFMEGGSDHVE
jgi:hypothetical protein